MHTEPHSGEVRHHKPKHLAEKFEGMVGIGLILDSPRVEFRAQVQTPGHAWRVGASHFALLLAAHPALRARLTRYA